MSRRIRTEIAAPAAPAPTSDLDSVAAEYLAAAKEEKDAKDRKDGLGDLLLEAVKDSPRDDEGKVKAITENHNLTLVEAVRQAMEVAAFLELSRAHRLGDEARNKCLTVVCKGVLGLVEGGVLPADEVKAITAETPNSPYVRVTAR